MKLTIDTQADSKDDLRKVIRFLQVMVNERELHNYAMREKIDELKKETLQTQTETPPAVTQFLNMFDTQTKTEPPSPKKETFKINFF